MVLIWDGIEFKHVSDSRADKLIKEDKAQKCEGLTGTQLKYRHEFEGYKRKKKSTYKTKVTKPEKIEGD